MVTSFGLRSKKKHFLVSTFMLTKIKDVCCSLQCTQKNRYQSFHQTWCEIKSISWPVNQSDSGQPRSTLRQLTGTMKEKKEEKRSLKSFSIPSSFPFFYTSLLSSRASSRCKEIRMQKKKMQQNGWIRRW